MNNRNRLGLRWGFGFGLFTIYIYISVAHACIEKAPLYRVKTEIVFSYRSHCNCLNLLSWFPGHILIMHVLIFFVDLNLFINAMWQTK